MFYMERFPFLLSIPTFYTLLNAETGGSLQSLDQAQNFGVFEKNSSEKKLKLKEKTRNLGNFRKKLKEYQKKLKDDVIFIK